MSHLSRDARALIDAARPHERATDGERRRVRARVLSRVGAGAAVLGTVAASSTVGTAAGATAGAPAAVAVGGSLLAKLAVGVAVVAAIGGGGALALHPQAPVPAVAHAAAPRIERAVAELEAATPSAGAASGAPEPEPPAVEALPAVSAPAPATAVARPRPIAEPSVARRGLDGELDLLQGAQDELRSGRADRALELLDQHEKQFAGGALREERQAARVLALCKAGRVAEARVAAAAFLVESPRSPQAARVRAACAEQ